MIYKVCLLSKSWASIWRDNPFVFTFRKRNPHIRQGAEDTYFSSSGTKKPLTFLCLFHGIQIFLVACWQISHTVNIQFPSWTHRAIKAFENIRGSAYIWGPQHCSHEVCHRNPPQPHNQRKSHWSWWVTAPLRQSLVGLNPGMLIDLSNPRIRCLFCAFSTA